MKTEVMTIGMDVTLKSISNMFKERGFHHALVVEDGELRGIISDRDILHAKSPFLNTPSEQTRDLTTLKRRAHQLMTRRPITIKDDADSEDAVQIMLQKNITCLPVLSQDGRIVGIVTWKDLLRAYSQQACTV
jgi:acetoin utilization protein AcuB